MSLEVAIMLGEIDDVRTRVKQEPMTASIVDAAFDALAEGQDDEIVYIVLREVRDDPLLRHAYDRARKDKLFEIAMYIRERMVTRPDAKDHEFLRSIEVTPENKQEVFDFAVSIGDVEFVNQYINDPDIELNIGTYETAAEFGYPEVLKVLLAHPGAEDSRTEMLMASLDYPDIVKQLLTYKDTDPVYGDNEPIRNAAKLGLLETVKALVEHVPIEGWQDPVDIEIAYDAAQLHNHEDILDYLEPLLPPEVQEHVARREDTMKWTGYTKEDVDLFEAFFEKPSDYSCCPICLAYTERSAGCMYMSHNCATDGGHFHEDLYNRFHNDGKIEWCTICGRISSNHRHYQISTASDLGRPAFAPVQNTALGDFRFFEADCRPSGGGGPVEKVQRLHAFFDKACDLKTEVGKMTDFVARDKIVEATWNGPITVPNARAEQSLTDKKFDFKCEFPSSAPPVEIEVAPDIRRPKADRKLTPIKHTTDNECTFELGVHEDNRPVWEFRHRQKDGTIYTHAEVYTCGEDLEKALKAKVFDGKCYDPACDAKLYPEELKGIVSDVYYEQYRQLFNRGMRGGRKSRRTRRNKKGKAGAKPVPILRHVDMATATCFGEMKKKGGRRTRRTKKK